MRCGASLLCRYLILALVFLAATTSGSVVQAQLNIDITRGVREPVPIAVTMFFAAKGGTEERIGRDLARVISADLTRSGLFRVVDERAHIQSPEQLQAAPPRYRDWAPIVQGIVSGAVSSLPDGRLRVDFRLWDTLVERQLDGSGYQAGAEAWRRIAHKIADAVYKRISGEDGYFDTQIVYISESGPPTRRVKRLAIMDQDGENHKDLTDGGNLILTPRFSPSAREITYLAYVNGKPRVYLFNIDNARTDALGEFPSMTFAPRFAPDGNSIIFSQAIDGNSDIFVMDLRSRRITRLTNDPSIDTAPSYAPDGRRIVFESDRGGSQQLYIMDADGGNVRRLTFAAGARYGSPVWSPRGDFIAFTKLAGGGFSIGVIRPDGTGERTLVSAFHVEGPTWAPNGRVLMYFKEAPSNGGAARVVKLYSIDLTGTNERQVVTPRDASDPAWSPLIP